MQTILVALVSLLLSAAMADAGVIGSAVQVSILTDSSRTLPLYPTPSRPAVRKAYAEATEGDHYRIIVRNNLNRRVGIVVAVDGRNIISGKQSWLGRSERMYVLEPYATNEYSGWRTSRDQVNRFYFTAASDSYAAAFNDESAMGVIAVAVYPEVQHVTPLSPQEEAASPAPARTLGKSSAGAAARAEADSAGTGYGRAEYSPSRRVEFEAEAQPCETIYLKYEWRTTLCRMGIVHCEEWPCRNRLWDDGGYAPPPAR